MSTTNVAIPSPSVSFVLENIWKICRAGTRSGRSRLGFDALRGPAIFGREEAHFERSHNFRPGCGCKATEQGRR